MRRYVGATTTQVDLLVGQQQQAEQERERATERERASLRAPELTPTLTFHFYTHYTVVEGYFNFVENKNVYNRQNKA